MTAPDLAAFGVGAANFLQQHAVRRSDTAFSWGVGDDAVAAFPETPRALEAEQLAAARRWKRQCFEAGYGYIAGPEEHGGRGLPVSFQQCFEDLERGFDVPDQSFFTISLGMVAPAIESFGSDVVKERYLRALHRGDLIGCQLFSEPEAGSDLANVQALATQVDGDWFVTGQKLWTSGAHYSDIGEILVRTDPAATKHHGLTAFIVDMSDPRIEVRPLRQMTGGASYNEVFFNEVRVPDDHRLGPVNDGWSVAISTLMNERTAIGDQGVGGTGIAGHTIDMARHLGCSDDPITRQMLVDLWIHQRVAELSAARSRQAAADGQQRGSEMSIAKLAGAGNMKRLSNVASHLLGPRLIADVGEWGTYAWSQLVLGEPAVHLAGGTDEVIRNIIGERVLGLPKEPRI